MPAVAPGIPLYVEAIALRALRKRPDERYADVAALRADLAQAQELGTEGDGPHTYAAAPVESETSAADQTVIGEEREIALMPSARHTPSLHEGTIVLGARPDVEQPEQRAAVEARLVIQTPDLRLVNKSFDVRPLPFSMGRAAESNLQSHDPMWSRRHAVIELRDGGLFVRDVESANGVFVDGRRVAAAAAEPLFFGAQIGIGNTMFRLCRA